MDQSLYEMIFKRKSFHLFRGVGNETLDPAELREIEAAWAGFEALDPEIKTAIRIVPARTVHFKRDAEYCIMLYSEKTDKALMNIGYLGEQLDLWLVSRNIGTLWFGLGKADEKAWQGLEFVIMIAIRKVPDPALFRKDLFKAKRRPLAETWEGDSLGAGEIARFAPSAVNSQPWHVKQAGDSLTVFRHRRPGIHGLVSAAALVRFNRIDIGIYLCILELCLAEKGFAFERALFPDAGDDRAEFTKVAVYRYRAGA